MESTDTAGVPRRVPPWRRKVAMFVLPLLAAVCAIAVWDYVEIRRLGREVNAIRAKGDPVTALSLIDPKYNTADNAEYKYAAAALLTLPSSPAIDVYTRFTPIREWLDGATQRPALEGFGQAATVLLSEWQEVLSLVDGASALPYRGIAPGGDYNYRVAGLWNLSRLLSSRTIALSLAGEADGAVDSAVSSIRLRRATRPSQLPAAAHEIPAILSLSKPSDAALARLQNLLAEVDDPDGRTRDFIEMRARIIDEGWRRWYRVAPGAQLPAPFPQELLVRPMYTHDFVRTLRVWNELAAVARKPWPERIPAGAATLARYRTESGSAGWNGVALAAALFHQAMRPDRLIHDRASRVAVAVERYRRAHANRLPATLDALMPQYLDAVPEDPVTGKPLRFHVTADAYIVYSVGPDGNDDGGVLLRQTPPSAAVRFVPGADIGVRVLITRP